MVKKQLLKLSKNAIAQIRLLLTDSHEAYLGVRISIRTRGCSGLAYTMEYVHEANKCDECIEQEGVKVFIDPKATMFLLGTTVDYVKGDLEAGFIFINPNKKGQCGCGESFHV